MSTERVTVGIVMPLGSQVGGAEALLGHLLRHNSQKHRYVCAFLQDGPLVQEVRKIGYETTVFSADRLLNIPDYLRIVWQLRSWIKQNRIQVVVSWMSKGQIYSGIAAALLPVRVIWFQHSIPLGSALYDRLVTLIPATAVFCCSKITKQGQDRLYPRRPTYVCYPGVLIPAEGAPTQVESRRLLGLSEHKPVVGMVARLERWKGAHVFVKAARLILERNPDTTMFIVGGPHSLDLKYAEELGAMVRELNCGDHFIMAGQRPMSEAILWQNAADVIVHPVTGIEPFGMAVAEAMAQGKVVVTSNIGGPSEIICDGTSGVLIERDDPVLLADTVRNLLEHPEQRQAIESGASLRGRSFSIDAFASHFENLINDVLALPC